MTKAHILYEEEIELADCHFNNEGKYEVINREWVEPRRYYDVWKYVIRAKHTNKFYSYLAKGVIGDMENEEPFIDIDDSCSLVKLTEVFPHTVSTVVYK